MESVSVLQQPLLRGGYFSSSLHLNFNLKICIKCRQLCLLSQKMSEMASVFLLWS